MEKKKILIVEDEAVIAMDLKSFLEQLGYTVLACVDSAEKALELAEQEPPDLVLLDIVLKGKMDGIEAADLIHSRWGIPVVFCTAYADQGRLDRAKLVHPFGYIIKPFQGNEVKVSVEMALYVSMVDREKEKTEEKYRSIFENAIEGIFQTTPDGRLLAANAALAHMLGYNSPEELIRSITDIENQIYENPDRRTELRRLLESHNKVEGFECPIYRKDGQVLWVSINIRAVRNEKGELLFYEGTNIDITEKKNLQTEIMQADRLSTIGELAAGVAHEINNPINGIINYAQMLIDQTPPGGEKDIPQRIIKEGERIASIVNNLLKFSRDRRENLRPISIQTLLNSILDLVGTQMKKDGIHISVKLPRDLPQVLINSQQIQQVFVNLLSNTRYALNQKYPGDHPEKTLTISGKKIISDQGLPQIRLNFRDAGIGIPKALLDKIFTLFFTTKLAEKGTGLGLSISRKIIQDHGGRLWLESREGKYTSAIVELPAAETEKY